MAAIDRLWPRNPTAWLVMTCLAVGGCKETVSRGAEVPAQSEGGSVELIGSYSLEEYKQKVSDGWSDPVFPPVKIAIVRERPFEMIGYRLVDEEGADLSLIEYGDRGESHRFISIAPGYGKERASAILTAHMKTILTPTPGQPSDPPELFRLDLGPLPAVPRKMPSIIKKHARYEAFVERMPPNPHAPFSPIFESLVVRSRGSMPKHSGNRRWQVGSEVTEFSLLRATYLQPEMKPNAGIRFMDGACLFWVPNAGRQQEIEVRAETMRKRERVEVVTLRGATLEEVFGKPVVKVPEEVIVTTPLGVKAAMPAQFHPPSKPSKIKTRTVNLTSLSVEPPKGLRSLLGTQATVDFELLSPSPEQIGVDAIRIPTIEKRAAKPQSGRLKTGPFDLVLRVRIHDWVPVRSEVAQIPLDEPRSAPTMSGSPDR